MGARELPALSDDAGRGAEVLKPGGAVVVATGSRILMPFKKPLHMYFSQIAGGTQAYADTTLYLPADPRG